MSTAELETKQNWDDCHFDQHPTHSIHLSGLTVICGQLKICGPTGFSASFSAGAGKVMTSDASGIGTWENIPSMASPTVTKLVCQTSHGFAINNVLGWSGGTYSKPIANGLYDGEVLGIVSKCYNVDCFDLTQSGYVTGLTGLAINTTYFLSDITAGLLTSVEPTAVGHIVKSVIISTSTTSGWVLPYPGYYITSGLTGGGITGATNGVCLYNAKNVCLGGVLTSTSTIITSGATVSLNLCTINANCCNLTQFCCGLFSSCTCDAGTTWKSCLAIAGFGQLTATNGANTQCNSMVFRPDAVYFTIGGTSSGLQYNGDYCTKFNANCRTLPDVDWVKRYVTANTVSSMSGTVFHIPVFKASGNNISGTTLTFSNNLLCNSDSLTIEVPNMCNIYLNATNSVGSYGCVTLGKPTTSSSITSQRIGVEGAAANIDLVLLAKSAGQIYMPAATVNLSNSGLAGFAFTSASRLFQLPTCAKICGFGGSSGVGNCDATDMCIIGGFGTNFIGWAGKGGSVFVCGGCAQDGIGGTPKIGGDVVLKAGLGVSSGANGLICLCSQTCASSTITATNFILSSDCRLKTCIEPMKISPINVEYKQYILISEPNQLRYGVIAQDLQESHPELVRIGTDGMLTIAQMDLVFKELAYLKNKVSELEKKIG